MSERSSRVIVFMDGQRCRLFSVDQVEQCAVNLDGEYHVEETLFRLPDQTWVLYSDHGAGPSGQTARVLTDDEALFWWLRNMDHRKSMPQPLQLLADDRRADGSGERKAAASPSNAQARPLLFNWATIAAALGEKNTKEFRKRLLALNNTTDGPIRSRGQGAQPCADRNKLIDWWNGLEERFSKLNAVQRNASATVQDRHLHGRQGEVVPEINGSVRRRRKGA